MPGITNVVKKVITANTKPIGLEEMMAVHLGKGLAQVAVSKNDIVVEKQTEREVTERDLIEQTIEKHAKVNSEAKGLEWAV